MLDHDYLVVVAPAMIAMPTVIAMLTEFGARVHMVAVAMLDRKMPERSAGTARES
jgi:hypothetical protein